MNLLRVKEAADALKISHPQARKMIGGELPADMVGREYRILRRAHLQIRINISVSL